MPGSSGDAPTLHLQSVGGASCPGRILANAPELEPRRPWPLGTAGGESKGGGGKDRRQGKGKAVNYGGQGRSKGDHEKGGQGKGGQGKGQIAEAQLTDVPRECGYWRERARLGLQVPP